MYPRSLRSYCQILRLWYQSVSINTSVKRHSVKPTLQNFSLDKQKEKCNNFFPFFLFFPLLLSFFFSFLGGETPTQGCSWYISNEHGLSMASCLQKHLIEFVLWKRSNWSVVIRTRAWRDKSAASSQALLREANAKR